MATLNPRELEDQVLISLDPSGTRLTVLSAHAEKPIRVAVSTDSVTTVFRIYAWNVTHGGNTRSDDEYRIQITGNAPAAAPGERLLILGWSVMFDVFAAWDPDAHVNRTSSSPSLQVHRDTLVGAYDRGIFAETRGSGDVAVAFQPELLLTYALNSADLHAENANLVVAELNQVTLDDLPAVPAAERSKGVQTVVSYIRAWDFKKRILDAYESQCAICGLQLGLVEAAHIVPVAWPGSTDETRNGLCLCRNHHRAYDAGLITVGPDSIVHVSPTERERLEGVGLDGGLDHLTRHDGKPLLIVPADPVGRPLPSYLEEGQRARRWR